MTDEPAPATLRERLGLRAEKLRRCGENKTADLLDEAAAALDKIDRALGVPESDQLGPLSVMETPPFLPDVEGDPLGTIRFADPSEIDGDRVAQPTVGRMVYYYGSVGADPLAAIVTRVHDDLAVDVTVFRPDTPPFITARVPHYRGGFSGLTDRWEWPPRG